MPLPPQDAHGLLPAKPDSPLSESGLHQEDLLALLVSSVSQGDAHWILFIWIWLAA